MITLDTNLTVNSSFNYLLYKLRRKYGYSDKNIDKYTENYAANGIPQSNQVNQAEEVEKTENVKISADELDFEQLVEDLKLNVSENRFVLLMQLPRAELFEMLQLLGKDKLLNGLKFFTKEKLMQLIGGLPKKDLLKMLFHLFTDKKQLIEHLPTKELYRFLTSSKIEKGHLMKTFDLLPKNTLATIASYLTKKDCQKMTKQELMNTIKPFEKYQLLNGIKKLDEKGLRNLITNMTESYPKLYNEFSHVALFNVADRFARVDLIDSMTVIDESKIMDMLSELPDKLLALTVSQIDPEVFAALLLNNYQDMLAELVLG